MLTVRLAIGLALALPISFASAQSDDVEIADALAISPDDECVSTGVLAAQVALWLGRDRVDRRLAIIVHPSPAGDTLEVVRDGEAIAERSLDAGDAACSERVAALGLMIALAIDATVLDEIHPEIPDPPVQTSVPPPAGIDVGIGIDAMFYWGLLPDLAGALAVSVDVRAVEWLSLRAAVFGALTADVPLAGGSVSSGLIAGRIDACPGGSIAPFRLEACAGIAAGSLIARGQGFSIDQQSFAPWAAVLLAAAGRVELAREVALRLSFEAALPFVRAEIVVADAEGGAVSVIAMPPVAAGVSLGVVFVFR